MDLYLFVSRREGLDLRLIDEDEHGYAKKQARHLGYGEGVPDMLNAHGICKQIRHGNENYELAYEGDYKAEKSVAESLEACGKYDAEACNGEAEADLLQCHTADIHHIVLCVKEEQELIGHKLEYEDTDYHNCHGYGSCKADGLNDTLAVSCAVVIRDDGDHTVIEAEHGHKDEALELEVYAEYGCGDLAHGFKGEEDLIEEIRHKTADSHHCNGGSSYAEDVGKASSVRSEIAEGEVDLLILREMEDGACDTCGDLTDDRCDSGTLDAHCGDRAEAEDEDRVENDIYNGTDDLNCHGESSFARCLKKLFKSYLHVNAEAADTADGKVLLSVFDYERVIGLALKECFCEKETYYEEYYVAKCFDKKTLSRRTGSCLRVSLAETF